MDYSYLKRPCNPNSNPPAPLTKVFTVTASDVDGPKPLAVTLHWKGVVSGSKLMSPAAAARMFTGTIGPYDVQYPGAPAGDVNVWITAYDGLNPPVTLDALPFNMLSCVIIG